MMKLFSALFVSTLFFGAFAQEDATATTMTLGSGLNVLTLYGLVQGHITTTNTDGKEVREFLGIPYARAPVGNLRFAPPIKTLPWIKPFNASTFGPSCYSTKFTADLGDSPIILPPPISESEDCLSVNVWASPNAKNANVMIWTYGGSFVLGSSDTPIYNGANIVANNPDIIVVSFNYRLNVFGYPAASGIADKNPGLRDVRAAVEWVRGNIHAFGGDRSKITLFGESAGGAAVDSYLYFNQKDPIIRGAILESGTASLPSDGLLGSVSPGVTFTQLATALKCDVSTPAKELACVRAAPATKLVELVNNLTLAFTPVNDNRTLFADINARLAAGNWAKVPTLVGSNDQEIPGDSPQAVIGTRLVFTCPAARVAKYHAANGVPTWQYRYFGNFPTQPGVPPAGPFHGSEITQVFGTFYRPISTPEQQASSKYIQGAWVAFARDPANGLKSYGGGWPTFSPTANTLVGLAVNNANTATLLDPNVYNAQCY